MKLKYFDNKKFIKMVEKTSGKLRTYRYSISTEKKHIQYWSFPKMVVTVKAYCEEQASECVNGMLKNGFYFSQKD